MAIQPFKGGELPMGSDPILGLGAPMQREATGELGEPLTPESAQTGREPTAARETQPYDSATPIPEPLRAVEDILRLIALFIVGFLRTTARLALRPISAAKFIIGSSHGALLPPLTYLTASCLIFAPFVRFMAAGIADPSTVQSPGVFLERVSPVEVITTTFPLVAAELLLALIASSLLGVRSTVKPTLRKAICYAQGLQLQLATIGAIAIGLGEIGFDSHAPVIPVVVVVALVPIPVVVVVLRRVMSNARLILASLVLLLGAAAHLPTAAAVVHVLDPGPLALRAMFGTSAWYDESGNVESYGIRLDPKSGTAESFVLLSNRGEVPVFAVRVGLKGVRGEGIPFFMGYDLTGTCRLTVEDWSSSHQEVLKIDPGSSEWLKLSWQRPDCPDWPPGALSIRILGWSNEVIAPTSIVE